MCNCMSNLNFQWKWNSEVFDKGRQQQRGRPRTVRSRSTLALTKRRRRPGTRICSPRRDRHDPHERLPKTQGDLFSDWFFQSRCQIYFVADACLFLNFAVLRAGLSRHFRSHPPRINISSGDPCVLTIVSPRGLNLENPFNFMFPVRLSASVESWGDSANHRRRIPSSFADRREASCDPCVWLGAQVDELVMYFVCWRCILKSGLLLTLVPSSRL